MLVLQFKQENFHGAVKIENSTQVLKKLGQDWKIEYNKQISVVDQHVDGVQNLKSGYVWIVKEANESDFKLVELDSKRLVLVYKDRVELNGVGFDYPSSILTNNDIQKIYYTQLSFD